MMKNYYVILGLPADEDSGDVILAKYREITSQLQDQVGKKELTDRLVAVNEAYLVLSDSELKKEYDYALSHNAESEELASQLKSKRLKAEQFVEKKLAAVPKKRKKRIWPIILGGILLCLIGGSIIYHLVDDNATSVGGFTVPKGWRNHTFDGAFSISMPPSMERRQNPDGYDYGGYDINYFPSVSDAVFQQRGLSAKSPDAERTYARVLIRYATLSADETEHHYESPHITSEDREILRELVDDEIQPYTYVDTPKWRWIDIDGSKALEGTYRRNGADGPVKCKFYILSNYSEMAIIIVSFREKDSRLWEADLNNVIRTFRWKTPR